MPSRISPIEKEIVQSFSETRNATAGSEHRRGRAGGRRGCGGACRRLRCRHLRVTPKPCIYKYLCVCVCVCVYGGVGGWLLPLLLSPPTGQTQSPKPETLNPRVRVRRTMELQFVPGCFSRISGALKPALFPRAYRGTTLIKNSPPP